jgi:hypothetical protein
MFSFYPCFTALKLKNFSLHIGNSIENKFSLACLNLFMEQAGFGNSGTIFDEFSVFRQGILNFTKKCKWKSYT